MPVRYSGRPDAPLRVAVAESEGRHYLSWKNWSREEFGKYSREDAIYFTGELARCGITTFAGLRVAELGFGNGAFAGWIRDSGGHWVGLEIIPALLDRARDAGFEAQSGPDRLVVLAPGSSLDLIAAFDVLEHLALDEIRTFLTGARKSLKPGGLLVARIPSGDSPFSTAIFRGDITHRTLLGSSAVRQLAAEAGFEAVQIRPPILPVWGLGPGRFVRRVALLPMRVMAFWFVRNVLMGNASAVVSPNMIAVLRKEGA